MSYKNILSDLQNILQQPSKADMDEYKDDFINMNIGSLKTIMEAAKDILISIDDPEVKNNLTASWLQGKIAVVEDSMNTIRNYVKFGRTEADKTVGGCGCGKNKKNAGPLIQNRPMNPRNEPKQPSNTNNENKGSKNRPDFKTDNK